MTHEAPPAGPLAGRIALVTGATSGIGFSTAREIARLGAKVYITGRDQRIGDPAVERIRLAAPGADVVFLQTGLTAVGANQELAERIASENDRLHILVNNIGGVYHSRWQTADFYEPTLGVQLAGPAALTDALLPVLERGAPARIVNVLPAAVRMWTADDFADEMSLASYLGDNTAARTKFVTILWTLALARRLEDKGVTVNAVDPGTAWTALTARVRPNGDSTPRRAATSVVRLILQLTSAQSAARATIFAATSPQCAEWNGEYIGRNCRPVHPPRVLRDIARQERGFAEAQRLIREAPTARGRTVVGAAG